MGRRSADSRNVQRATTYSDIFKQQPTCRWLLVRRWCGTRCRPCPSKVDAESKREDRVVREPGIDRDRERDGRLDRQDPVDYETAAEREQAKPVEIREPRSVGTSSGCALQIDERCRYEGR